MTGVVITVGGSVSFQDSNVGFLPPVSDSLEVWAFLGGSLAKSAINLAPNKLPLTVVGSPTVAANKLTLKNVTNYLQTACLESDNMTMIAVVSKVIAGGFYISNNSVLRAGGSTTYVGGANLRTAAQNSTNNFLTATESSYDGTLNGASTSVTAALNRATAAGWRCVAARLTESAGTARVNDLSAGDTAVATRASGSRDKSTGYMRIGSGYLADGTRADDVELAFACIYSKALSDEELATVYAYLQTYFAARGMTI